MSLTVFLLSFLIINHVIVVKDTKVISPPKPMVLWQHTGIVLVFYNIENVSIKDKERVLQYDIEVVRAPSPFS